MSKDDVIEAEGKGRTVDDVCSLLNMIFKAAIKHNILINNPMDMVFHAKHEREHGSALSKDEEKMLLESVKGTVADQDGVKTLTDEENNVFGTVTATGDGIISAEIKVFGEPKELEMVKADVSGDPLALTTTVEKAVMGPSLTEFTVTLKSGSLLNEIDRIGFTDIDVFACNFQGNGAVADQGSENRSTRFSRIEHVSLEA